MQKRIIILGFFLSIANVSFTQNCDCENKFLFLKNQIEKNYAGFNDKVPANRKAQYNAFSENILKKVQKTANSIHCLNLMNEWLLFFKDGHIQISNQPNVLDTVALNELIQTREIIRISQSQLTKLKNSNSIEGIYYYVDSTYKIALVKNKSASRDYAGIIISSKTPLWKPGQVKLELKEIAKNEFAAGVYMKNHDIRFQDFIFDGNSFNSGAWIKEGVAPGYKQTFYTIPVQSKKISDKTFYIGIGTFEEWNAAAIDSTFKANEAVLKSVPNLILDLRGNGGGADFSYGPISPYLYTNPVYTIGVDVLASEDNIKGWMPLLDNDDIPQTSKDEIKKMILKMQEHIGQYVSIVSDDTIRIEKTELYPKHIVILTDRLCRSTTEQFLLEAVQSKKVTLMGEHTEGVLDYSNMRDIPFPCSSLRLFYATTRSRRINAGKGIDNMGIKPNIRLAAGKDWILEARKFLER